MFIPQYRHAKAHQEILIKSARRFNQGGYSNNGEAGLNKLEHFLLNISDLLIAAGEWIRNNIKPKACESVHPTVQ